MHHAKRYFFSMYLVWVALTVCAAVWALGRALHGPTGLDWRVLAYHVPLLGALLAGGVPLVYFVRLYIANVPRTSVYLWPWTIFGVLGAMGAATGVPMTIWPAVLGVGSGALGWILYVHWYAVLPRGDLSHLRIGMRLPAFSLVDTDGVTHDVHALTRTPALWLFYRGNWCPLCVAQVHEYARAAPLFAARGVRVLCVSTQPVAQSQALADALPLEFLVDPGGRVVDMLKLGAPGAVPAGVGMFGYGTDAAFPTVLLTAKGGNIAYLDATENERVRPKPDVFLKLVDTYDLGDASTRDEKRGTKRIGG